jgi:hypothetical protein
MKISQAKRMKDIECENDRLKKAIFDLTLESVLIENWQKDYNTVGPHSRLDYRPPAPGAFQPLIFEPFGLYHKSNNPLGKFLSKIVCWR